LKLKNCIIFIGALLALSQCKPKEEEQLSNIEIVRDNALAASYFHAVFREAEYAWAMANENGFKEFEETEKGESNFSRTYKFDENTTPKSVTVTFNPWVTNDLLLTGSIKVELPELFYRRADMKANIKLPDFAINGQDVVGTSELQYLTKGEDENDQYSFKLLNGSAIHEEGYNVSVLISASIANGRYERIAGGETLKQNDDVWKYTGTMTGILREIPQLTYTNALLSEYYLNDIRYEGALIFTMTCTIASQGGSNIAISERSDIQFVHDCSGILFENVKHNIK